MRKANRSAIAELFEYQESYVAYKVIVRLMRKARRESVWLRAAQDILDCLHGKPTQPFEQVPRILRADHLRSRQCQHSRSNNLFHYGFAFRACPLIHAKLARYTLFNTALGRRQTDT